MKIKVSDRDALIKAPSLIRVMVLRAKSTSKRPRRLQHRSFLFLFISFSYKTIAKLSSNAQYQNR